jgi:lysyl-tRNA synthetase class 2
MAFTEELTVRFLEQASGLADVTGRTLPLASLDRPFPRMTYEGGFQEVFGQSVLDRSARELRALAISRSLAPPTSLTENDRDGWLNFLLAEAVEPRLAERPAVYLYDYPASQAALARVRPEEPPVAERFELYVQGVEICNGYQELTDANELRDRMATQSRLRADAGLPPLPRASRLLDAMDAGLPECAGVALGFDRLLMVGLGLSTIDAVMAFPFQRS